MYILLLAGILLIALSFIFRDKWPPFWGFLVVLLIMGFQEGVEGDFMNYKSAYEMIESDHIAEAAIIESESEPVMTYLMTAFSYVFPFWFFVFAMSFFQCYVLYKLVNRYTPKTYGFLAAILFFFTFNMMLLQMKAMRQGLAIELMVLAFLMADRKKTRWLSLLVVLMAYFSHNSMLVVLPFYLLFFIVTIRQQIKKDQLKRYGRLYSKSRKRARRIPAFRFFRVVRVWWRKYYLFPIVMVVIFLVMYFFKITVLNQYLIPLMLLTGGSANRLASYASTSNMSESLDANMFEISPLIVLYDAVIVFLVSDYLRTAGPKMRVFCIISITAAFGDMLFYGAGAFARMIMYYVVFNLIVYPSVALRLKKKYGRLWALVFMVFLIGYAVKTSLPWITGMTEDRFGTYRFVFMP